MFSVKPDELLKAINKVSVATEGATSLNNIYACILFSQNKNSLELTASDSQVQVSTKCKVKADGKEAGNPFAVNARKFKDILNNIRSKEVKFSRQSKNLIITTDTNNRFQLAMRNGGEFPRIGIGGGENLTSTFDQAELKTILDSVQAAISNQNHRIYLAGAYFDFLKEGLHIVATDGHRLATDVVAADAKNADNSFILPRKAVNVLKSLLGSEGEITLEAQQEKDVYRTVSFTSAELQINCSVIQGQYPNYARVIPDAKTNKIHCHFDVDEFQSGLKQVCAVHDKAGEGVKLNYTGNGELELSAKSSDGDEAQVGVAIKNECKDSFACQLNSSYLADMLDAFKDHGKIQLAIKDEQGSVLCVPVKAAKRKLRYVVMPMR